MRTPQEGPGTFTATETISLRLGYRLCRHLARTALLMTTEL